MSGNISLAQRIATQITDLARAGEIAEGEHLSAQKLADRFGVSRFPVRAALEILTERGELERRPRRGYFVVDVPRLDRPSSSPVGVKPFDDSEDYHRFAEDWLADRIPAEVTAQMLRARYGHTHAHLNDLLLRAMREGWAERKPGYGWRLLPVAKTPDGFAQLYRFRLTIEPAALLEPGFRADREVVHRLRRMQNRMLESDIEDLPAERLLRNGSLFHEELIRFSQNFFFHQALERVNRMRRLLEYKSRADRTRIYSQCVEHLHILDLVEAGRLEEASEAMRSHLGGALAMKAPILRSQT